MTKGTKVAYRINPQCKGEILGSSHVDGMLEIRLVHGTIVHLPKECLEVIE